jgi:hypothetical protein
VAQGNPARDQAEFFLHARVACAVLIGKQINRHASSHRRWGLPLSSSSISRSRSAARVA